MQNTTYILFGSTNGYQAQGSGLFRGRTKIAIRASYGPREQESKALLDDCCNESDSHTYNKWGTAVQQMISCDEERNIIKWDVIMELGEMSYHHDGYSYESIAIDDLSEEEARVAIRDNVLNNLEIQRLYELHPDLAPATKENSI